jgi:ribosome-associated heat shock protein Hsp15
VAGVPDASHAGHEHIRLDKWLWAARFFKSRSLAAAAVTGGRVHVNGTRVKPSRLLAAGDIIAITKGPLSWTVVVRATTRRRGPASEASLLYDESAESREAREQATLERRAQRAAEASVRERGGRPSKRDRRRFDRLHDRDGEIAFDPADLDD